MSTNSIATRAFLIEFHANQLMQISKNRVSVENLIVNEKATFLLVKLLNNGIAINPEKYEPVRNCRELTKHFSKVLNITFNKEQLNFIAEEIFYPHIIHAYKVLHISISKDDLSEVINKDHILPKINLFIKSNLNTDQVKYLCLSILENLTVYNLDGNDKHIICNAYHLIRDPDHVIASIEKIITPKKITIHEYYVLVARTFQSLSLIDKVSIKEDLDLLISQLATDLKITEKHLSLFENHKQDNSLLSMFDPTLAKMYSLDHSVDFRVFEKRKINLKAALNKIKRQKGGLLSKKCTIKRAFLSILFLGQMLGIKNHDNEHNFEGNEMRNFIDLIIGGSLIKEFDTQWKQAYNLYMNNSDMISGVHGLIQEVNTSNNKEEALQNADQTFAAFATEILVS